MSQNARIMTVLRLSVKVFLRFIIGFKEKWILLKYIIYKVLLYLWVKKYILVLLFKKVKIMIIRSFNRFKITLIILKLSFIFILTYYLFGNQFYL
jgi:hypothetical protein